MRITKLRSNKIEKKNLRWTAATLKSSDSTVSDNYKEKRKLKEWNKSSDLRLNTFKQNVEEKTKAEKHLKKDDRFSNTSNSTLSLHIATFENSTEAVASDTIKKRENKKEFFISPTFVSQLQNPFEFPRQENDKISEPEVSQFRASQRLLNFNEGSTNGQQNVSVSQQQQIAADGVLQQQRQFPTQILQQPHSSVTGMQRYPLQQAPNSNTGNHNTTMISKYEEGMIELKQKLKDLEAFIEHPTLSFTELCTAFRNQYGINLQSFYEPTGTSSISQLLRHCSDVALVSFDEDARRYTITLLPFTTSQRTFH